MKSMTTLLTEPREERCPAPANILVELAGVGKKYKLAKSDFWALRDINFSVEQGRILGILGRNGAGKTTLLNIIAGALAVTEGKVSLRGKVLALFNLCIGFQDELSGRENIFLNGMLLGASRKELESKLDEIIAFSELGDFIEMPLGTYSQGMRLRLGFSVVVNLDFDILVIDEVLAVGDALFQNKCFQRLTEFRRAGKTLIITNQGIDLIKRLSDTIVVVNHGRLVFLGNPEDAIARYQVLLNTEQFSVLPQDIVKSTKRSAGDISAWGQKLGTKEAVINNVEILNKWGFLCQEIETNSPLKVKVHFAVKDTIKESHFGVAIFREDGMYCYGPNTQFDNMHIPLLKPGSYYFIFDCEALLLAPGRYYISVAIWDKDETVAYDYHNGCYHLTVSGKICGNENALTNIPFKYNYSINPARLFNLFTGRNTFPSLDLSSVAWGQSYGLNNIEVKQVKFLDIKNKENNIFFTGEPVKIAVSFNRYPYRNKDLWLWIGIYRSDGVYCQGIIVPFFNKGGHIMYFPELALLPGGYAVSIGIWSSKTCNFLMYQHGLYPFAMEFNRQDHGTVFLKHTWIWNY